MISTVELKDLSVAFEGRTIIDSISFSLTEGDIACLLGPSGCGKTTLLRTEVWISGIRVSDKRHLLPVEQRQVGMVFQDFALFPHLSVRENIAFGLSQLPSSLRKQRIAELVVLMEIGDFLDRYPHQLSGGQRRSSQSVVTG